MDRVRATLAYRDGSTSRDLVRVWSRLKSAKTLVFIEAKTGLRLALDLAAANLLNGSGLCRASPLFAFVALQTTA